jgi:hypothetical protein
MEANFRFVPWKVPFTFSEYQNWFFVRQVQKAKLKVGTTPHINSRTPRIRISALVSLRHPFGFRASSYRFRWNRGGFAL